MSDLHGKSHELYRGNVTLVQADKYATAYVRGHSGSMAPDVATNGLAFQRVFFEWFNVVSEIEFVGRVKLDNLDSFYVHKTDGSVNRCTWSGNGYYMSTELELPTGTHSIVITKDR